MEKINLSDLLEPEHMDPVKRIALIRIVDDDGELIGKGLVGATNKEIAAIALEVLGIVALY